MEFQDKKRSALRFNHRVISQQVYENIHHAMLKI